MLANGKLDENLYILDINKKSAGDLYSSKISFTTLASSLYQINYIVPEYINSNSLKLWHQRLAHALVNVLKRIFNLVYDFKSIDIKPCTVCHISKQHKLPFSINDAITSHVFCLVHVDLWGPHAHFSISDPPYVFTLVDDISRVT